MLEPLGGRSTAIDNLILALIIGGMVALAVGAAWGWYARKKRREMEDVLDLVADQQANNDNDHVPAEVLSQYIDHNAKGSETGNIAPGAVTMSGRVAGDTEQRFSSDEMMAKPQDPNIPKVAR